MGWFREADHFLVKNKLEKSPIVDGLVATLAEILLQRPIAEKTSYDLSHDIDVILRFPNLYKFIRSIASSVYRKQRLSAISASVLHYLKLVGGQTRDPYDCYDWLFPASSKWQQKTLFLMTGGETRFDNFYSIEHPKVLTIIEHARKAGYDLGIHPSYNAAFKADLFLQEKEKLEKIAGQPIYRNRQHWLRFDWDITPYLYEKNAISEDCSLGFRRRLGFRCGTGFPYRLYDFNHEKAFSWTERPLSFMESSAIHEAHRTNTPLSKVMTTFLELNSHNTHVSFNFHNSNFDPTTPHGPILKDFYTDRILS